MTVFIIEFFSVDTQEWVPISKPYFESEKRSGKLKSALKRHQQPSPSTQYRIAAYTRAR